MDGCRGSLAGLGGGGGGADGVSNITAEYFVDLKRVTFSLICFKFIMAGLKMYNFDCVCVTEIKCFVTSLL